MPHESTTVNNINWLEATEHLEVRVANYDIETDTQPFTRDDFQKALKNVSQPGEPRPDEA